MTGWIMAHSAQLVATAALLMVMLVVLSRDGAVHRERMERLASSGVLLEKHRGLLVRLIEDERISDALKLSLLSFSATMVDDNAFMALWRTACGSVPRPSKNLSVFDRELAQLYSVDPELGACLELAVSSLVMAMVLKSDEAQDRFADAISKADPRALFASAMDAKRRMEADADFEPGMLPA